MEDEDPDSVDLDELFTDDAVEDTSIRITIGSNDNPPLLEAKIDDQELIITLIKDQFGVANITLIGHSRGSIWV